MRPFETWRGSHLHVTCQIVHVDTIENGTLVDLVTLEASDWHGTPLAAGTPFAVGFTTTSSGARDEMDTTMRGWEQACAVLELAINPAPDGLRYEFDSGYHQLIVTVDEMRGI